MFSGIVSAIGLIKHIEFRDGCKVFIITPDTVMPDLVIGESMSVNGACLSITDFNDSEFHVTAVPETLRLTNLAYLDIGHKVNLERSLRLGDRIGGHQVQGHVDAMGKIMDITLDNSNAWLVKISLPDHLSRYVVKKGYITLDGMSITVIDAEPDWFTVTFIPHTQDVTITKYYSTESVVNIEVDILGKYIEKLMGAYKHADAH
jgi:riboflavin synthase